MNMDVVRMLVSANWVKRDDDIWLKLTEIFDHFGSYFIHRVVDLGISMFICIRSRHTGISIAKKEYFFQAKVPGSILKFNCAKFSFIFISIQMFRIHTALFATRSTDQISIITLAGV